MSVDAADENELPHGALTEASVSHIKAKQLRDDVTQTSWASDIERWHHADTYPRQASSGVIMTSVDTRHAHHVNTPSWRPTVATGNGVTWFNSWVEGGDEYCGGITVSNRHRWQNAVGSDIVVVVGVVCTVHTHHTCSSLSVQLLWRASTIRLVVRPW